MEWLRLALWILVIAGIIVVGRALSRRRPHLGPGTAGTIYDWLNADKRNAIEIIDEERAEARDPEDAEGNLPDLAGRDRRDR